MTVLKDQRALIVISELTNVPESMSWLYRFIELSGRGIIETILKDDYSRYITRYDENATKQNLLDAIAEAGSEPSIRAIDLVMMLHGEQKMLQFNDNTYDTPSLARDITALGVSNKLRLVYSVACYAASHGEDFTQAGFKAAIGALKVNANAEVEFPVLLKQWSSGREIQEALSDAEKASTRFPADQAAREFASLAHLNWKDQVDSHKVLTGDQHLRIDSGGEIMREFELPTVTGASPLL